ncbi:hypothetical protein SFOMI_0613 [Sphingobium fuliginis]|uniref:Uncharacterized protein n=1 Tax=Sphingobium fuliginis (strain ATCC 27551) TaxID=336203 RepID=A0A292ZB26_SPHSA|nr:hypothetical protein SFOMI_0613 [Sphingobium fuliginis]
MLGLPPGHLNSEGTKASDRDVPLRRPASTALSAVSKHERLCPAHAHPETETGNLAIPDIVALPV